MPRPHAKHDALHAFIRHQPSKKKPAHVHSKKGHSSHSPFFVLWELITLACVFFVAEAYLGHPYIHVDEQTEHVLEVAVESAEVILISEMLLLILVARNKIHFIQKNWLNILAVVPFGGGTLLKVAWHAFEKTKVGHFLKHPFLYSRRWFRIKLGLRA